MGPHNTTVASVRVMSNGVSESFDTADASASSTTAIPPQISALGAPEALVRCRVCYLGASPVESEGGGGGGVGREQSAAGLQAVQKPLAQHYSPNCSEHHGIDAWLTVYLCGVKLSYTAEQKMPQQQSADQGVPTIINVWFPISNLSVCAAVRCIPAEVADSRTAPSEQPRFVPLDVPEADLAPSELPIFTAIFRQSRTRQLECFCFLVKSKQPAMALVHACTLAYESYLKDKQQHQQQQSRRNSAAENDRGELNCNSSSPELISLLATPPGNPPLPPPPPIIATSENQYQHQHQSVYAKKKGVRRQLPKPPIIMPHDLAIPVNAAAVALSAATGSSTTTANVCPKCHKKTDNSNSCSSNNNNNNDVEEWQPILVRRMWLPAVQAMAVPTPHDPRLPYYVVQAPTMANTNGMLPIHRRSGENTGQLPINVATTTAATRKWVSQPNMVATARSDATPAAHSLPATLSNTSGGSRSSDACSTSTSTTDGSSSSSGSFTDSQRKHPGHKTGLLRKLKNLLKSSKSTQHRLQEQEPSPIPHLPFIDAAAIMPLSSRQPRAQRPNERAFSTAIRNQMAAAKKLGARGIFCNEFGVHEVSNNQQQQPQSLCCKTIHENSEDSIRELPEHQPHYQNRQPRFSQHHDGPQQQQPCQCCRRGIDHTNQHTAASSKSLPAFNPTTLKVFSRQEDILTAASVPGFASSSASSSQQRLSRCIGAADNVK